MSARLSLAASSALLRSGPSWLTFSTRRSFATLYTAKAHTTGGRNGQSKSDDGRLSITLSTPKEMGGQGGGGTNPEQLFASGYAACFIGAMGVAAKNLKKTLPNDVAIDSRVSLNKDGDKLTIGVEFDVTGSGNKDDLKQIVEAAHQICQIEQRNVNTIAITRIR